MKERIKVIVVFIFIFTIFTHFSSNTFSKYKRIVSGSVKINISRLENNPSSYVNKTMNNIFIKKDTVEKLICE